MYWWKIFPQMLKLYRLPILAKLVCFSIDLIAMLFSYFVKTELVCNHSRGKRHWPTGATFSTCLCCLSQMVNNTEWDKVIPRILRKYSFVLFLTIFHIYILMVMYNPNIWDFKVKICQSLSTRTKFRSCEAIENQMYLNIENLKNWYTWWLSILRDLIVLVYMI